MSDVVWRVLIVGVVVLAVVFAVRSRRFTEDRAQTLDALLEPGVYLFTARSCLECDPARVALEEHFGEGGFVEVAWESDRGLFDDTGIDSVPTTLLVSANGTMDIVEGIPGSVLDTFSP